MSEDRQQPIGIPGAGIESSGIPGTGSSGITGLPGSGAQPARRPSLRKPSPEPTPDRPTFQVPEPPQPLAGMEAMVLAGWGVRFGASIIDGIILLVLTGIVPVIGFVLFADEPFSATEIDPPDGISNLGGIAVSWFLLYVVGWFLYPPITMVRNRGATWGKKLVGIRVVTDAGATPTFGRSLLREAIFKGILINGIGGAFFLPWLLSYLWPLWDDQSRAGHDFMAKTRVIRAS